MNNSKIMHIGGVFAATSLVLALVVTRLLQNNYVSVQAQYSLAMIGSLLDTGSFRLENIGFEHPHGPLLTLIPFYSLPFLKSVAPFALSVTSAAMLVTLWYGQLSNNGYTLGQRILLLVIIAAHPAFLWSATAGGDESIALLFFYLLYLSTTKMIYEQDIRSFMILGLVMAAFFYFNVISIYLLLALLPLLLVLAPISLVRESPMSALIIIGLPIMIVIVMWLYLNWIFLGYPLAFLGTYNSAFLGAMPYAETQPWLNDFGGQFFHSMLTGLGYTVAGYPVLLYLIWRHYLARGLLRIPFVLMFFPVLAIGLATWTYYLASPVQISSLIIAGVMAEMGSMDCIRGQRVARMVILLIIGTATSWYIYARDEYSHATKWVDSLHSLQDRVDGTDIKFGHWLAENRLPTLIDMQSGFCAIAARGDAKNLILPFSKDYRLKVHSDKPNVPQIAVPEPDTPRGKHDRLNVRFPRLFETGMPGYERVYDENGWRVYRRVTQTHL